MPKHSLYEAKQLIHQAMEGDKTKVWLAEFNVKQYVADVCKCSMDQATLTVGEGFLLISESGFVRSENMLQFPEICWADLYALEAYRNHNWYVKFSIEADEFSGSYLNLMSFHPAERAIRLLANKKVIPTTITESEIPKWRKDRIFRKKQNRGE